MKSSDQLRRELREAERREKRAKEVCISCDGKGYICDTTYNRAGGDNVRCGRCNGTGLPHERVEKLIDDALRPYRIWPAQQEGDGDD